MKSKPLLKPGKPNKLALAISLLVLTQTHIAPAYAQDETNLLEEIIVTAQRREQSLQEVPLSLTALTGDMLAEQGIDDFQDFSARVPGFDIHSQSSVESNITLRGISPMGGSSSPVAVYIDDMPISGIQGNGQPSIKSFDVERIEILRGPQGTLYGEGSLGGTIKIIMNKPDTTAFAAKIDGTASSTTDGGNSTSTNIMLNLPIIEGALAARAVLQHRDNAGFVDAPNIGKEDVNSEELLGGRLSLRWLASENLTVDLAAIYQDVELDGRNAVYSEDVTDPAGTLAGSYRVRETSISVAEPGSDQYGQYNMTVAYNREHYQFVSSTSYYDRETAIARDLAGLVGIASSISSDPTFVTVPTPLTGIGNLRSSMEEIFTQEFRVSYAGADALSWQAGVFYKDRQNQVSDFGFSTPDISDILRPDVDLGAGGAFGRYSQNIYPLFSAENTNFEQRAVFGEINYEFNDKLIATIGARYFEEKRESTSENGGYFIQAGTFGGVFGGTMAATGGNVPVSATNAINAVNALGLPIRTEDQTTIYENTWKLNLSYQLSDEHMVYGTVSKGFRAGGANTFSLANEGLTGMPIGTLPRSYDPDTLINYELGAKTSWYEGRVTLNGAVFLMDWQDVQVRYDPTGLGFPTIINAESAHSQGIEIEAVAIVSSALELNFSAAYTDAKLDDDVVFPDGSTSFEKGGNLAGIPNYTYNIGGSYRFDILQGIEGVLRANYSYKAEAFKDPAEIDVEMSEAYGLATVSLAAISDEGWQVKLFVNNLSDETAGVYSHSRGEFLSNRPRTFGINASVEF